MHSRPFDRASLDSLLFSCNFVASFPYSYCTMMPHEERLIATRGEQRNLFLFFHVLLITRRIDSLRHSRPLRQLWQSVLAQTFSHSHFSAPTHLPAPIISPHEWWCTYYGFPFYTSSPSYQRSCICPSAPSLAQSASPRSIFPRPWSSLLVSRALRSPWRLRYRLREDVCADELFGIWTAAMGSSYRFVRTDLVEDGRGQKKRGYRTREDHHSENLLV